jgi:two-component system cell cycle response regulator
MTDHLTGSLSRHALVDGASSLIAHARQGDGELAVIMVDFDHFKQINDQHGHAGGDSVLRHAVQVLQAQLRGEALLARYGGEEFVVLAPVSDLPVARRVAERMRQVLEETSWPAVVPGLIKVTRVWVSPCWPGTNHSNTLCAAPTKRCTAPRTAGATRCR